MLLKDSQTSEVYILNQSDESFTEWTNWITQSSYWMDMWLVAQYF